MSPSEQRMKRRRGFAADGAPRNVMFSAEFAASINKLITMSSLPDWQCPIENCITCNNFDEQYEICKLVNVRPPARVIAFGCDSYDDKIPF